MVHRDVKEANIIVREPDGEAVLVDFGVSGYEKASRVTRGKLPPGTVEYRSPEAWRFLLENEDTPEARYHPTPKDDLFALGAVLYWLLTDVLPFAGSDAEGVEELLTRPPVAPHVCNPSVPKELSALCLRLLEKRPEARPDTEAVCKAAEELLAREGAAWDEPLCEFFSVHNVTTIPDKGADSEARWLNELRQAEARPRRGRRPPLSVEASAPVAPKQAPPADAAPAAPASPAPQAPQPAADAGQPSSIAPEVKPRIPSMERWGRTAASLALVVALSALASRYSALLPRPAASPATSAPASRAQEPGGTGSDVLVPTWEGRKVAPPLNPPEAARGLPGFEEAVPVPVAPAATLEEDDASVKTPKQKKRLGAVKKAIAAAGACTALGCPGVPVRPSPEPKPCPPGAVKAMKERGIHVDSVGYGALEGDADPRFMTVTPGWTDVELVGPWGDVKSASTLSGELIFGEKRVYGRLTQARTKEGTFPVCIEMWDTDGGLGLIRKPNGKVFNRTRLHAVDHFE